MAGVLDGVDQRTKLAGHNRFELLLFKLKGRQRFGINVFKVQEVIQCPKLTNIPQSHSVVCGVAYLRGKAVSVVDLSMAIGFKSIDRNREDLFLVVTEYNRSIQGFLVGSVERIINISWDIVKTPPKGSGREAYLTAVTRFDDEMIEVLDVEKVMSEVMGSDEIVSLETLADNVIEDNVDDHILVVDDSMVARNQIKHVLEQMGVKYTLLKDGLEGWQHLLLLHADGIDVSAHYSMIISDVEMPRMDGYMMVSKIREHADMKGLYIILHTSMSGNFNESMVERVGANEFIPKFKPDHLAKQISRRLHEFHEKQNK